MALIRRHSLALGGTPVRPSERSHTNNRWPGPTRPHSGGSQVPARQNVTCDEPPRRPCRALVPRLACEFDRRLSPTGIHFMRRMLSAARAALPLFAALVAASCDKTNPPSSPDETAPVASGADSTAPADTL